MMEIIKINLQVFKINWDMNESWSYKNKNYKGKYFFFVFLILFALLEIITFCTREW